MAKKQFKSESKRLLDLMINSIYTHKEIFLREIISNASDAIDKLCFIALTDDKLGMTRSDFNIFIEADKDSRTLKITDNGIGMDKDDLENNLGTIANSGSFKFKNELEEKPDDIDIIGQFGVGFYSAFMVAKEIVVNTKKYGCDTAYCWQSSGADGYTITEIEKDGIGTEIILTLKDNTDDENYDEFLEQYRLQSLVKKYSDYIRYPILMDVKKSRVKEETKDSDKPEYEDYTERETLNSMVPIWQRPKKDVKQEDFREVFMSYKQIMNMSMTKLAYFNGKAVGFYVSIPDYGNLVYHTGNPINIAKILMTKKKPQRYVMLYMGVDQQHRGLGKALVYAIMKELMASGLPSIGALMRDGKLTQTYANGDITGVYEYVLLERKIEK